MLGKDIIFKIESRDYSNTGASEKIHWQHDTETDAKTIINNYIGDANTGIYKPDGTTKLKGLLFDADDIIDILKLSNNGSPTRDKLAIFFALRKIANDQDLFSMVAVGVKKNEAGDYMIHSDIAYDFCEPCPSNCPANLDALLSG